jgi:hypothetical protein
MFQWLSICETVSARTFDQAPFLGMANRLGPVSAARSRPCPAKGAGRAADQGLPRGELGSGRVRVIPRNNTGVVVRARDSNPHGPRPAARQRGSGPRPAIISISVGVYRGLWPGRSHLRLRGGPPLKFKPMLAAPDDGCHRSYVVASQRLQSSEGSGRLRSTNRSPAAAGTSQVGAAALRNVGEPGRVRRKQNISDNWTREGCYDSGL